MNRNLLVDNSYIIPVVGTDDLIYTVKTEPDNGCLAIYEADQFKKDPKEWIITMTHPDWMAFFYSENPHNTIIYSDVTLVTNYHNWPGDNVITIILRRDLEQCPRYLTFKNVEPTWLCVHKSYFIS